MEVAQATGFSYFMSTDHFRLDKIATSEIICTNVLLVASAGLDGYWRSGIKVN